MPIYAGIDFEASRARGAAFHKPNPIGIVCHRTELGFSQCLKSFLKGPKCSHFLIGKAIGNAVQLVDTNFAAAHVKGANALYIGIEFESILARPGFEHRQDPLVNADPLTRWQCEIGRQVINFCCKAHEIRLVGPPARWQMAQSRGHFHGVLNHSSLPGFFPTDHGDALRIDDWNRLIPITDQPGDFPSSVPGRT
jgi:hypothetical protein